MKHTYDDLAIILSWPDATIRGDERWMMFFRKVGLVKNLNFRVGHTGVILVHPDTRALIYYDFGRYIAPRGLGRARSPYSDPRLKLYTTAVIQNPETGEIANLKEIAEELETIKDGTQGEGRLYFSVATGINFQKAKDYADTLVEQGSTPYGAFAWGNNNCSRFITRMLMRASRKYHFFHGVNLPESIKSSPISNVVNVRPDRMIFVYDEVFGLRTRKMNRFQSLGFLLRQLLDNFLPNKAVLLPDDKQPGSIAQKPRPGTVPTDAQWLGGVGEGAWYHVTNMSVASNFEVSRYTETGELEYRLPFFTTHSFEPERPFKITYDSHMLFTTVKQDGQTIRLHASLTATSEIFQKGDTPLLKPASR